MGMSASRHCLPYVAAALIAALAMFESSLAATGATKDEAVALVKKAVAFIQTEGPANAYPEITNPSGRFVDRDLYIVVYGLDGMVYAHGADAKRVGTNQIGDKDPDGKAFVKERVELAATNPNFWHTYKFLNPVTKQVEPKEMYCERLDQTVVCGGIYQL
jgi:signal transduction histidine kinase